MSEENVLVVGQGEIGVPLATILGAKYRVFTKDLEPLEPPSSVDVIHICYPYDEDRFVPATVNYVDQYQPSLTIIHSTVVPGTTRAVHLKSQQPVAYSAVRGKHPDLQNGIMSFTKFAAGVTPEATARAMRHLADAGMTVEEFSCPEALELAKLLETSYCALLIAWAQEQERYCEDIGVSYNEVTKYYRENKILPPVVFQPGFIGGHCLIPNTHLLDLVRPSSFMKSIRGSNDIKRTEWLSRGKDLEAERLEPLEYSSIPERTT